MSRQKTNVLTIAKQHFNNFDILRLLMASLVIYVHSFSVLGLEGSEPLGLILQHFSVSTLAVYGFFVLSGFLIFQSLQRSKNIIQYFTKRIRRLMPALILVTTISTFFLGAFLTNLPLVDYFRASGTYSYWWRTVFFIPNNNLLPGVFEDQSMPYINGSLWTLRYELMCYVLIVPLGKLLLARQRILLSVFVAVLGLSLMAVFGGIIPLDFNGAEHVGAALSLCFCFFLGALAACFKVQVKEHSKLIFLLSIAAFLSSLLVPLVFSKALIFFSFPIMILSLGLQYHKGLQLPKALGDISYGTYIFGFPIQQILVAQGVHHIVVHILLSLLISWAMGYFSYHFVEKRFIK